MRTAFNRLGLMMIAACLAASTVASIWALRGLYSDAAYFFLFVVLKVTYFIPDTGRSFAYWLTQFPLTTALHLGVTDITWLTRLYTAGLSFAPIAALLAALWIARNDAILFAGSAIYVAAAFYPPALFQVGEFHVCHAFAWLAFVCFMLPTTGRLSLALMLAVFSLQSYETSLLLGPQVAAIALVQSFRAGDPATRTLLRMNALVFALGAPLSVITSVSWKFGDNTGHFRRTLFDIRATAGAWYMAVFATTAAGAALITTGIWRYIALGVAAIVALVSVKLIPALNPADAGFGIPYNLRSFAFAVTFGLIAVAFVLREWFRFAPPLTAVAAITIALPVGAAFAVDMRSTIEWHRYLGNFCREISASNGQENPATAFYADPLTRKYGWMWTAPVTSFLIRGNDDSGVLLNVDPKQTPPGVAPDLSRYKVYGSICDVVTR